MINKLTRLSIGVWVKHCSVALLMLVLATSSFAGDRPMAGGDDAFRQQLFIERSLSQDISPFEASGRQYSGGYRSPQIPVHSH